MSAAAAGAVASAIPEKSRGIISIIIVIFVIAIIVFIISKFTGGFNSILEALGLKRDEEEERLDKTIRDRNEQAQNVTSPWSPDFYRNAQANGHAITLMTSAFTDSMADQIWDSVGRISDTPTKAVAAVKQFPTKAAISFLAERFALRHDRDLWNWMVWKFDTDDQKQQLSDMAHYVDNLPPYKR